MSTFTLVFDSILVPKRVSKGPNNDPTSVPKRNRKTTQENNILGSKMACETWSAKLGGRKAHFCLDVGRVVACSLLVSGRIWRYMAASGLAVSRRIWLYLAVTGGIWPYLDISGRIWRYLAVSGCIWQYLALSGYMYLGVSGCI